MNLPESYRPYTDKYFLRTNEILRKENLNPRVSMKIFTRGEGEVVGIDQAVEVLLKFSDLKDTGEIWVTKNKTYKTKEPLMIIKGPIQSFEELETVYLGVLSDAITTKAGIERPNSEAIKEKLRRLKAIYCDKSILYFGARHYHWSLDKEIAKAALESGAVQTSTDIGSSNINVEGAGTIPHVLVLMLAYKYGREIATLKAAELFDKYMPINIPRITLVDTFNKELSDALSVAKYFRKRKNSFRLDTCGENIGEGGIGQKVKDPTYQKGAGVTVELVKNLRKLLIDNQFGDNTDIVLSSGFGNEEKAKIFMKADAEFKKETGYNLFSSLGIGEVSEAKFCTADIFEIEGKSFSKVGREIDSIDYSSMECIV